MKRQYAVQVIGRIDQVRERFYAISVERRLKHRGGRHFGSRQREALRLTLCASVVNYAASSARPITLSSRIGFTPSKIGSTVASTTYREIGNSSA